MSVGVDRDEATVNFRECEAACVTVSSSLVRVHRHAVTQENLFFNLLIDDRSVFYVLLIRSEEHARAKDKERWMLITG